MKIGKELALEAKKCTAVKMSGDCFKEIMQMRDIKPLCARYFRDTNWAMENDFPNITLLRKYFSNATPYGFHTDFVGSVGLLNSVKHQSIAFFGNSVADVICSPFAVCEIFIRHNSKVKIVAEENAFIVVNLLDAATVEIEAENASVKVYQYGTNSNFTVSGNVEIIEKTWQK